MRALAGMALAVLLTAAVPAAAEPWALERSQVERVASSNGATYRLLIAWPEGDPPANGWPVLWLLDGEQHFATAALTARRLAEAGTRTGIEPGLIVGVDSGALAPRVHDYTPATPGYAIPPGMPAHGLRTGGAEAFLDVVEQELQPLVAGRWAIDPARQTLAGHSLGGLLVLHALETERAFSAFAAISPSLWFGGRDWSARAAIGKPLLLAHGSEERTFETGGTAEALAVGRRAASGAVGYLPLEGHDHGTTMLGAMAAIIQTAFGRKM